MDSMNADIKGLAELGIEFDNTVARVIGAMREAAEAAGDVLKNAANAKAPSPHIVREVTEMEATHVTVAIGPDKKHWYFKFWETGAKGHAVKAKKKGALVFMGDHGMVLIRGVSHPGMKAKPFLRPAIDEHKDAATEAAVKKYKQVMGL